MSDRVVVVDAGAVIHGAKFEGFSGRAITTTGVYREIKDKQAQARLTRLPFEIETKEPTPADLAFIKSFAKETGDLGFLSANDLEIMALTYMLQRETGETSHLKSKPEIPKIDSSSVAFTWGPRRDHFKTFAKKEEVEDENVEEEAEDGWETVKSKKKSAKRPIQKRPVEEQNPAQEPEAAKEKEQIPESESKEAQTSETEVDPKMELLQACEEEESEWDDDWSEDGSDAGEWVTPENLHRMDIAVGHEDNVKVACITGDYSAQNVLLQIGLSVLTFDGYAVKNVKIWGLVCRGCFHFTRDSTKQFCQKCGNSTVQRVPITVDAEGKVTLHHNPRRRRNLKGTIYDIPKSKGGRRDQGLILAEDQMMMGNRDKVLKRQQKLYDKDRQMRSLDSDTVLTQGWHFRQTTASGRMLDVSAPKMQVGYGRKNPNANNFRRKKK